MTVRELIEALQKLPPDIPDKSRTYIKGAHVMLIGGGQ